MVASPKSGQDNDGGALERSSLERHAQTVLQVLVTAALIWVGSSMVGLREDVVALKILVSQATAENVSLKAEIRELRSQVLNAASAAASAASAAAMAATRK